MSGIELGITIIAVTTVGFIGGIKAGVEIAKFFEERSTSAWKDKWNVKLNDYWLNALTTPFPRLASVEAGKVRAYLKKYFSSFESPFYAKLAFSLLLTSLAFFIGDLVYVLSHVFGFGYDYGISNTSFPKESLYMKNAIDAVYGSYLVFRLIKVLQSKVNIKQSTQNWIILWVLLRVASSYTLSFAHNLFIRSSSWIFHWTNLLGLVCLIIGLGIFYYNQKRERRGLPEKLRIVLIGLLATLALISPWLFRLVSYPEGSNQYPISLIFFLEETAFYFLNIVADFTTFAVTLVVLQWISKGRSVENCFYILVDLFAALAFAVLVAIGYDIFSHFKELIINPILGPYSIREVISSDAQEWKLGPLLFSLTTLIPSVIFMAALIGRFLAKIVSMAIGRLSHYLFWKRELDKQPSPVYMTIVLFGVIIGIAMANITLMRLLVFLQV